MNKKLLTSLLLIGMLSGCGETSSSSDSSIESSSTSKSSFESVEDSLSSDISSVSTSISLDDNSSISSSSISSSSISNNEVDIPTGGQLNAPTSGYALYITQSNGTSYYLALTPTDEFEGFQQYFGDNVELKVGDVFQLFDGTNGVAWVEDTLNNNGQYEKFEVTSKGIQCNVSGVYDIYVKFKWEADEIYIGNEQGS